MVFRVVIFREGDWWVAQCVDHDVAAQARSLRDLPLEFEAALVADVTWHHRNGIDLLMNLVPAPEPLQRRWAEAVAEGYCRSISLKRVPEAEAELCVVG